MGDCKKVMYASEQQANADIARIKQKSTRTKLPTRAYQCTKCNLWHLTSLPDYKALYTEQLAENQKIKSGAYVKSLELKVFKLQQKLDTIGTFTQSKIDKELHIEPRIKTLNATISKQASQITKLKKEASQLINELIVLKSKTHEIQ